MLCLLRSYNSKVFKGKRAGFFMKRELYDLTDEPFTLFVNRVGDILRKNKIEHNIVGGVSVQAYILKMLTEKYGNTICELNHNHKLRIQDYIRSTDDVDLALNLGGRDDAEKIKRINKISPDFACEEIAPCGESIVEIKPERVGASRPTFRVYVDDKSNEDDVIAMNISRNKGDIHNLNEYWYDELIKDSQKLVLPYTQDYSLTINVPTMEHLLATKIAGARAKDLMDEKNLVDLARDSGIKLNFDELERILLSDNRKKYLTFLETHYPERLSKLGLKLCSH